MSCSSIRSRVCWAFRRPREVIKQLHRVMAPTGEKFPPLGGDQHLGGFQRDGGGERVGQSDDLAARPVEVGYDVIGGAGVPGIGDDQQAVLRTDITERSGQVAGGGGEQMDVVTHLLEHEGQIVGRGIGGTHPGDIDGPGLMQDLLGAGKGIHSWGGVQGLQQADVVLDGPLKGVRSGVLGRGLPGGAGISAGQKGPTASGAHRARAEGRIALKIQPAGKAGDGGRTDPGPLAELIDGEKGHLVEIFQNKISQPPVAFGKKRIVVGADLGDNIFLSVP